MPSAFKIVQCASRVQDCSSGFGFVLEIFLRTILQVCSSYAPALMELIKAGTNPEQGWTLRGIIVVKRDP